ncbi:MAG: TPM domain-containing protein [Propionibacteriaceae bacterium]|jgi:uncharacterized protein|nr:TPM domain-containing protein [Propionibacteriaceae bacterium]
MRAARSVWRRLIGWGLALGLAGAALLAPAAQAAPVSDQAGILSAADQAALGARIEELRQRYDFDLAITTLDWLDNQTPAQTNEERFRADHLGDGLSLLVVMGSRDWDIWATPGRGHQVFTDYGLELIGRQVRDQLSAGDYRQAGDSFIDLAEAFLAQAQSGAPYDTDNPYRAYNPLLVALAIGGGVGAIVALSLVLWWRRGLKTARPAVVAASYQAPGSLVFSIQEDHLISSRTAVVPLPPPSSSGGGGGGGISVGGGHAGGKF